MHITYHLNQQITAKVFIDVLNSSSLGERRPVDSLETIQGMLEHADILITATVNDTIVGVARAVTDYHYCCYLSDLAVDIEYQHQGIGKALIAKVQAQLQPTCKLILLSAPDATHYYPKVGFTAHNSAWVLKNNELI